MRRMLHVLFGLLFCASSLHAQVTIPGTEVRQLHSQKTGRDYDLYVYLPARDRAPNTKHPVLYLLDGQWDFKLLASIQGGLLYDRRVPDVIVVGITYSGKNAKYDSLRALDYAREQPRFLDFMKTELLPFIERNYPADPEQRALMGASLGGWFTLYAMLTEPSLFAGYAAGSPAVTSSDRAAFAQERAYAAQYKDLDARLFVMVGDSEPLYGPTMEMVRTLRERAYPSLRMESHVVKGERHSGNKPEGFNRAQHFLFGQPKVAKPATSSLKQAYASAFKVGAAVNEDIVSGKDSAAQRVVLEQFNSISPENVLKAASIYTAPGVYNWAPADAFVEFGRKHNMFILAHTLVWHNQVPPWFFTNADGKPKSHDEMVEQLRSHIERVAGRYAGKVQAWDVVNEVIDNDGSYRQTAWVNAFGGNGDELVKLAFKFAAQYAPNTELYYNDFNEWRPSKRDGIVRLIRMLQKEGIRIDGVGMQAHYGLNYPKNEYIAAAIDSFAATGVKVMITELDVDVLPVSKEGQIIGQQMTDKLFQLEEFQEFLNPYRNGLPDAVQQQLADRYAEIFRILYEKRDRIDRVTFWGVGDGMSWKNSYPLGNRVNYPLLWDRAMRAKPALQAVLSVPQLSGGR